MQIQPKLSFQLIMVIALNEVVSKDERLLQQPVTPSFLTAPRTRVANAEAIM